MDSEQLIWDKALSQYMSAEDQPPKFRFIKGRIPLNWITTAATLPGKALHTALVIRYLSGLVRKESFFVSVKIAREFGLSRQALYRGLGKLESAGLISVERKPGRLATVTLLKDSEVG